MTPRKVETRRARPGMAPGHAIESAAPDSSGVTIHWQRYNDTVLREEPAIGLDALALEDVHNGQQRSKLELYGGHSFMVISVPVLSDAGLEVEQLSLFLGPHWVISFWSGDQVDNLTELTASLHEMHLSAISQRMNDVMRLLTVIATIF
ncbi:MAG: hypothetical protein PVI87_03470, partial [Gammaproteobacteria bacterium]